MAVTRDDAWRCPATAKPCGGRPSMAIRPAMVMIDDSPAVGFTGPRGRGTHELHGVVDRVDIITGTLGKALGGASGGYVAARPEIVAQEKPPTKYYRSSWFRFELRRA
jgi:hypothetical protein